MLFHSILDSLIVFGALHAGAPFGYADWLAWFWYTALLNMAGGLLVVTALRLVRSKELIERERAPGRHRRLSAPPPSPPGGWPCWRR